MSSTGPLPTKSPDPRLPAINGVVSTEGRFGPKDGHPIPTTLRFPRHASHRIRLTAESYDLAGGIHPFVPWHADTPRVGTDVPGVFTPVLAKHSKYFLCETASKLGLGGTNWTGRTGGAQHPTLDRATFFEGLRNEKPIFATCERDFEVKRDSDALANGRLFDPLHRLRR